MRFETLYRNLEDIALQYQLPLSTVITTWDISTNKLMRRYNNSHDDLSMNSSNHSQYDVCREQALTVIKRYFKIYYKQEE